jgi:hypothetical protein
VNIILCPPKDEIQTDEGTKLLRFFLKVNFLLLCKQKRKAQEKLLNKRRRRRRRRKKKMACH